MKLEQSIEKLESYVLKNSNTELEELYLEIKRNYMELCDDIEILKIQKEAAEEEVDERRKAMWNDPKYRMNITRQIASLR